MDPTARYEELIRAGAEPLDELAFSVAAHARRDLDIAAQLDRLDALAAVIDGATAPELCRHLFVEQRFVGDRSTYYDPRNSFLDRVLDRRRGIPITLSVLAMEVGRRIGVPLVGIGMPGHFLIREVGPTPSYFDPFDGGRAMDAGECEARFHELAGPTAEFDERMLAPVTSVDVAGRMLANLTRIYLQDGDRQNLVWVLRLRSMLPGSDPQIRRQLAGVLAGLGRFWEAADLYEGLITDQPSRAAEHRSTAARLRAHAN